MNAVEIEEAVSKLVEAPFERATFPYEFLRAFGQNDATLRKLQKGDANKSDILGGVLQRSKNNIHLIACGPGDVATSLAALRNSPATVKHKARFILATDGQTLQAERFDDGEVLACDYSDLPNRFAYFLSLAGISTVKRIDENAFDIRATGRLNKLYVELLKVNPDWDTEARRQDLNHFFARLIFCFFAEDTSIFIGERLFTSTIEQMTERNGSNVHEVLSEVFRAMNIRPKDRQAARTRPYADSFPYVNGNLFDGSTETPRFNQAARNYLLFVGNLDWKLINPDIFGSMIQAVADDEERGALGMHYTSVPNILKVLNPLFLDDLRAKLEEAGDGKTPGSARKLLNLRNRLARIRVFDPACGSGNFLVIAYKEMRQIEAEINQRRGEVGRSSEIPISNFRGIELRHFPAEIARLALIIAEFQCNVLYSGELFARQEFLPLDAENWITCGNALRIDWLSVCPPTGTGVRLTGDNLFNTPKDQAEIDFENQAGETYICGNPPYLGGKKQDAAQKRDMQAVFGRETQYKNLDYICAFILKGAMALRPAVRCAFVSTSSVNQGTHVPTLWPRIIDLNVQIIFCHLPFQWSNNAANNAGVHVTIIGIAKDYAAPCTIFDEHSLRRVKRISPYLTADTDVIVYPRSSPLSDLPVMLTGNAPYDGGNLLLSSCEKDTLVRQAPEVASLLRPVTGTAEFNDGKTRWCLWINDDQYDAARRLPAIRDRLASVLRYRTQGGDVAQSLIERPHQFRYRHVGRTHIVIVPQVSPESRTHLPVGYLPRHVIATHLVHVLYDGGLLSVSILSSKLHRAWLVAVAGRLGNAIRYSSNICWNTFPVPTLTDENKAALTRCAEDILLAREAHFPATIADMYDPEAMDTKYPDLRAAHERNDETLERIYIGRRFRNDTERLEKLFEMYTEMTAKVTKPGKAGRGRK